MRRSEVDYVSHAKGIQHDETTSWQT